MHRRRLLAFAVLAAAPGLVAAAPPKDKAKDGAAAAGASYIPMNTLTATIRRGDGRRGVLTLAIGLDIPDEKLRAKADSVLPRIRAAFVQSLQNYASGIKPGSAPSAEVVTRILQRETDRVLGQQGARLLLGTMLVS